MCNMMNVIFTCFWCILNCVKFYFVRNMYKFNGDIKGFCGNFVIDF